MKKILLLCGLLSIFSVSAQQLLSSNKAPFHLGETKMVCGKADEVFALNKRTVINLDGKYPSQTLSLLIWEDNKAMFDKKFGSLQALQGQRVCGLGKITEYKGHLQIVIKQEQHLRLMKQ
ncbi:hypothetical protein [Morganella morganii]|uniref:hypothetical protein n=1 Tax=Morganella morganii TaxID=582 RepID=UPI003315AF2C